MTTATPLARYGAIEGALPSGFATAELHHVVGHDLFEVRGTHEEAVSLAAALKRRMRFGDTLRVYPVSNAMLRFCITHGGAPIPESNDFLLF